MTPATKTKKTRKAAPARRTREESRARIIAAAAELVRDRSYAELSVGEVMDAAGIGRTLFYRYFDDLADLFRLASREAIEDLYAAEVELNAQEDVGQAVSAAVRAAVSVYSRHGPLLRALSEAAMGDPQLREGEKLFRARFDELVASRLRELPAKQQPSDIEETAHALNLLNTSYLLAAFGNEPRVSEEVAAQTLTAVWLGVFDA